MSDIYSYMEDIMPVKRVLISLTVGIISLMTVCFSGLTSGFVRQETLFARSFSAFCFSALATFILLMSCEEYAIYKTKRELQLFIDQAQIVETPEDFNKEEYFPKDEELAQEKVNDYGK